MQETDESVDFCEKTVNRDACHDAVQFYLLYDVLFM